MLWQLLGNGETKTITKTNKENLIMETKSENKTQTFQDLLPRGKSHVVRKTMALFIGEPSEPKKEIVNKVMEEMTISLEKLKQVFPDNEKEIKSLIYDGILEFSERGISTSFSYEEHLSIKSGKYPEKHIWISKIDSFLNSLSRGPRDPYEDLEPADSNILYLVIQGEDTVDKVANKIKKKGSQYSEVYPYVFNRLTHLKKLRLLNFKKTYLPCQRLSEMADNLEKN